MVLVCTQCSRANAEEARYCYYDGVSLLGAGGASMASRNTFLAPFVFPSGQQCKDFDQFAHGCLHNWDAAREMLANGRFQQFFGGLGRMDLMQVAQEMANFPDRQRGLDVFLARLPTKGLPAAKLSVEPKRIDLGTLKGGQNSHLELTLKSEGSRLLFGSVSTSCNWLQATESGDPRVFQFRDSASIVLQINGQFLRAGLKPLEGEIFLESNGGTFEIKVVASVPLHPFPEGCLAGARTPRELAEKAKKFPKDAGTLFASGAVGKWYQANGWIYPVDGPAHNGMAAVQQFFEALGLSKPPKVFIAEPWIELKGKPGAKLTHQIVVRSEEHRPVYAHATSPLSWCILKTPILQGNAVTLPVEVVVPPQPGEIVQGFIRVMSNGQQRFDIPVQVTVERGPGVHAAKSAAHHGTGTQASKTTKSDIQPGAKTKAKRQSGVDLPDKPSIVKPPAPPPPASSSSLKFLLYLAPVALIGLVLIGFVVKSVFFGKSNDVIPPGPGPKEVVFKVAIQDEPDVLPKASPFARVTIKDEPEERFEKQPELPVKWTHNIQPPENNVPMKLAPIAKDPLVSYTLTDPPTEFGVGINAAAGAAGGKSLTFMRNGTTNSTVVSVNGSKLQLGAKKGSWTRKAQPLDGIPATPGAVNGTHSTWTWGSLAFHQVLEVVPGQPVLVKGLLRRPLDTVLVRWILENTDRTKAQNAGLRMELDTQIGLSDGVPFTVPGNPGLINTNADLTTAKEIPDFIQALEQPDLRNPGVIAHLTLQPGAGIESASRFSLTRWSGAASSGRNLGWEIPVRDFADNSSVVLYWPERAIKGGESRTIGFAYGLGNLSVNDNLGVVVGGAFEAGKDLTVCAYVENPLPGQKVSLTLPNGLRLLEGSNESQMVIPDPDNARKTGIVTWKVAVEQSGEFKINVSSQPGSSLTRTITIPQVIAPAGGKLTLSLKGEFEPGKVFTVIAKVKGPSEDQELTLNLPPGALALSAGLVQVAGKRTVSVPKVAAGTKEVQWQVKVVRAGKYLLRVESDTKLAATKTLTVEQEKQGEGIFTFEVTDTNEIVPGKAFTVSAKVKGPRPDQKLTIVLPPGLQSIDGEETQIVRDDEPLLWKVKVEHLGKFIVGLKSTTGILQSKTVLIESAKESAGRFEIKFSDDVHTLQPGKEFKIDAQVANPAAGQTLKLILPKGLQLVNGDISQEIPAAAKLAGAWTLSWTVRALEAGRLPVRIESSTGLTRTKSITLSAAP